MIDGFEGTTLEGDTFRWKHDKDGKFYVCRIYRKQVSWMPENKIGPWKHVWKSMAPTKVKCFPWLLIKKAYLTHEVLQKKGFGVSRRNNEPTVMINAGTIVSPKINLYTL